MQRAEYRVVSPLTSVVFLVNLLKNSFILQINTPDEQHEEGDLSYGEQINPPPEVALEDLAKTFASYEASIGLAEADPERPRIPILPPIIDAPAKAGGSPVLEVSAGGTVRAFAGATLNRGRACGWEDRCWETAGGFSSG